MKEFNIRVDFSTIHTDVCNLCAAFDWLQQVSTADGKKRPLITEDMEPLLRRHYHRLMEHIHSVLSGWCSLEAATETGAVLKFRTYCRVSEAVVRSMLESYMIDATIRKFSGRASSKSYNPDETLYLLITVLTPETDSLYEEEDACMYYGL